MSESNILRAALFTPGPRDLWGLPMRIVGGPGTGKSDIVTQIATEAGFHVKVVIASLRDPTDFLGLPVAKSDGKVGYAPPDWAAEVSEHPLSVVFFDEINTCSPATQAALLRVVLDRVVGDFVLPRTVRIVAAQNGVSDAAGGYDLAMPLANRFGTLADWKAPDVDAWSNWLVGQGCEMDVKVSDPAVEQQRVEEVWPAEYARASGLIATFIARKPSLLHAQPAADSPQASLPWPSRRTWAMATRALAASRIHNLDESDTDRYVGSFVGLAAMVELRTFTTNMDLPNPADLLDGKVQWRHDKRRLDRTMSVLAACTSLVLPKRALRRADRTRVLWALLRHIMEDAAADVLWPSVKILCSRDVGLERGDDGKLHDDATSVLERFHPMLKAAGLIRDGKRER